MEHGRISNTMNKTIFLSRSPYKALYLDTLSSEIDDNTICTTNQQIYFTSLIEKELSYSIRLFKMYGNGKGIHTIF